MPRTGDIPNREKILESACYLFYHIGYAGASLDDVFEHSGVVKSNFYYHFSKRHELALAVLDRYRQQIRSLSDRTLCNPDLRFNGRLEAFFDALCHMQEGAQAAAGCPLGTFVAGLPVDRDAETQRLRVHVAETFDELQSALTACLECGIAEGSVRSDISPAQLAELILGSVEGLLILVRARQCRQALREELQTLHRLLAPMNA